MESLDQIARVHKKIHRMTTHQLQTQFENQWYSVQTTAIRSNTIPTRQHPQLGQAHRDRTTCNSTQRATVCQIHKFLFTSTTTAMAESLKTNLQNATKGSCDLSGTCGATHSPCTYNAHHWFSQARVAIAFRFLCGAAIFQNC